MSTTNPTHAEMLEALRRLAKAAYSADDNLVHRGDTEVTVLPAASWKWIMREALTATKMLRKVKGL